MVRQRSGPIASLPAATQSRSAAPKTRQALKEKTNTSRAEAPVYEDDGDADGLVKDAPPRRGRPRRMFHQPEEVIMAGGLGAASSDDKNSQRTAPPPTTDELAKSDGLPPPTARASRRQPPKKVLRSEAQSQIMEDVKKRMEAIRNAAAKSRKPQLSQEEEEVPRTSDSLPKLPSATRPARSSAVERSEFSLSPSPPPPGKLTSVGRQRSSFIQPGSALHSHGTPAVETSILALKNFKRRPRQPSMLQMVQQRTASARPSAVHATEADESSVFDFDEIEDDFAPEAEGTPFHISKKQAPLSSKSKASSIQQSAANPRKRKPDNLESTSPAVDALVAKRRKSIRRTADEDRMVDNQDSPSAQRTSPTREKSTSPPREPEAQVINSSPSSTPPTEPSSSAKRQPAQEDDVVVPSTEQEQNQEDDRDLPPNDDLDDVLADGTMAEPASSPPPFNTQQTDIMADPLTQVSPRRVQPDVPAKKKKKPHRLTTAALQSLLPKRRQPIQPRHRKSEYDMDSDSEDDLPHDTSHLDGDEDELGATARRQTKPKPSAKKAKGKPTAKSRQSKAPAASTRKSTVAPRKSTVTGKQTRTYGKAASDKENDNTDAFEDLDDDDDTALPDTSMSMYEAAQSKELEAAKKKFARIDDYELEFESMSFEEHRSSSQGWR